MRMQLEADSGANRSVPYFRYPNSTSTGCQCATQWHDDLLGVIRKLGRDERSASG